jgi:hypothetical protein
MYCRIKRSIRCCRSLSARITAPALVFGTSVLAS